MPGFNLQAPNGGSRAPGYVPLARQGDPARTYRWRLGNIRIGGIDYNPVYNGYHLRTYVSLDIPSLIVNELKVKGFSVEYKFPKSVDFPDITVEFYDLHDKAQSTLLELEKMANSVWSPVTGLGSGNSGNFYKGVIEFYELDNEGYNKSKFTLYNAWPKEVKNTQLDMSKSEIKRCSIKFAHDWYTYKYIGDVNFNVDYGDYSANANNTDFTNSTIV